MFQAKNMNSQKYFSEVNFESFVKQKKERGYPRSRSATEVFGRN